MEKMPLNFDEFEQIGNFEWERRRGHSNEKGALDNVGVGWNMLKFLKKRGKMPKCICGKRLKGRVLLN